MTIGVFSLCLLTVVSIGWAGNQGRNGSWGCPGKAWKNTRTAGAGYMHGNGKSGNSRGMGYRSGAGRGQGSGTGVMNPGGAGQYYLDKNGDGVCDNAGRGLNAAQPAESNR